MQLWNGSSSHSWAVIHPVKKGLFSLAAFGMGRRRHGEPGAQSERWIIHGPSSRSLCVPFCYLCLHLKGNVGWGLSCFEHHILSWSLKRRAIPRGLEALGSSHTFGCFLCCRIYIYIPSCLGTEHSRDRRAGRWCSPVMLSRLCLPATPSFHITLLLHLQLQASMAPLAHHFCARQRILMEWWHGFN